MAWYCNGKQGVCDCSILCQDCQFFDNSGGKEVQTNGDKLRAMTDEELAKWLDNFFWGHKKANLFDILKWLKQPVEE